MELWDLYDARGNPLGRTRRRDDPPEEGTFCLVASVWIVDERGRFLISRRAAGKTYPLCWETTGGGVLAGESPIEGALREAREEVGVHLLPERGRLLWRRTRWPGIIDTWLFAARAEDFTGALQPEEVMEARWMEPREVWALWEAGAFLHLSDAFERVFAMADPQRLARHVETFEALTRSAHPALRTEEYDGWLLRFAGGFTGRSNSAQVVGPSRLPLGEKIAHCEAAYRREGLPALFKVTDRDTELDTDLERRGYELVTPTRLMARGLRGREAGAVRARVGEGFSPAWTEACDRLHGLSDEDARIAGAIRASIRQTVLTAAIEEDGGVVACGSCVVERGYAGLYDIIVAEGYRRRGFGRDVCAALLNAAVAKGAHTAYLQVVAANEGASRMYRGMGFVEHYEYHYRREA